MSPAPVKNETDTEERPKFKFRDRGTISNVSVPEHLKDPNAKLPKQKRGADRHGHHHHSVMPYHRSLAWLLFFALGGALYAMRYQGWLSLEPELKEYGPYALLGIHVVLIGLAFREDPFQGALCLLVPGYTLYFLVVQSGRAFLCALTFGLLVGVGEDSWGALQEVSQRVYADVNDWIGSGGK